MRKLGIITVFLTLFITFSTEAQKMSAETIEVGTDVENREIVGSDTLFSNNVETLYCFTRITGARDTTTVMHVWYYESEEKGRVNLKVRTDNWRTWSSKRILPTWTGSWKVEVLGPEGELLGSKSFKVESEN